MVLNCYILIYMFMQDTSWRNEQQTQENFFIKICTSHFIVRVRKGLLMVCVWEGADDRTETAIFWPQTPSGFPRAPSAGCGFPWHISSFSVSNSPATATGTRTQLSYIIVQRPVDLWNRMFNRHQAEITVMQFRGHSLPVRQSMRVSWDFFSLSHFVSQFPPTRFPLLTAIGMCHFLPVHHLEWHFWPGRRSKYYKMTHTYAAKQNSNLNSMAISVLKYGWTT